MQNTSLENSVLFAIVGDAILPKAEALSSLSHNSQG